MKKRSSALAVLSAAAVLAAPAAASAASGAPAAGISAGPSASGTTTLSFRGMNLQIPSTWKVHRDGDQVVVATGACPEASYFINKKPCKGFWLFGPEAIKRGDESFGAYTGKKPFYPSTGVQYCPFNSKSEQHLGKATARGLRQVGPARKAKYTAWAGTCEDPTGNRRTATYTQREWFLPGSKILVVDLWNHKSLPDLLKRATWS
ncbi:hypothetical protein GCM10010517_17010 [Streptosporangium fragile]|uniref:Serine/threonine protein kinase n=1 Tax=Streptosporangium fragile TaxID=46186 RepID=A0ABN3VTR2_9ACTN